MTLTIECDLKVQRLGRRKVLNTEEATPAVPMARIPRVARLMALAIRFEGLLASGVVKDYAELARLGHVTRSRVSQVMNLRLLDPQIQEAILFLPATQKGHDAIKLAQLQPIALEVDWGKQQRMWRQLVEESQ